MKSVSFTERLYQRLKYPFLNRSMPLRGGPFKPLSLSSLTTVSGNHQRSTEFEIIVLLSEIASDKS
jgi:hypothetical protein